MFWITPVNQDESVGHGLSAFIAESVDLGSVRNQIIWLPTGRHKSALCWTVCGWSNGGRKPARSAHLGA